MYSLSTTKDRGDYSSALIHPPDDLTDNIICWGFDNIPDDDLFMDQKDPAFGRENDVHITLLYGLRPENYVQVAERLSSESPFHCSLGKLAQFTNNRHFDVLNVEVNCDDLHRLHRDLRSRIYCPRNFPVYVPHVTIAYLRKGLGKKYTGEQVFEGESFTVREIILAGKGGIHSKIRLGER